MRSGPPVLTGREKTVKKPLKRLKTGRLTLTVSYSVTLTPYPSPLKHSKTPAQTPPPSPGFAGRDRHHRRVVSSPVRPFIHLSLAPSEAFPGSQRPRGPQAAIAVACSSAPPLRLRWPLPSSSLVFASSAPSFSG
ncbi:uncharacterized protein LOC110269443 [Arachis ipaensis]|uniref:uncharacterized protein LOC110269443 n=1 Tax=Arachis ipaensis TaxID=130454 RepID=UPI000A2B1C97|nr:uncharacterized protein LOC110269443 [Arachis ipaensis]